MEKEKLPHATLILVFGIVSIITCCCYGIIGLIFGIIAIVLANKTIKKYRKNPELYSNYSTVKTGNILAIVGVVLNLIYLIYSIYIIATIGFEGIREIQGEFMDQYGV